MNTRIQRTRTQHTSDTCRCHPKPYVLATFRNTELVSVRRMHNLADRHGNPQGCQLPPEPLNPDDWR